jgi:hypothetical protein
MKDWRILMRHWMEPHPIDNWGTDTDYWNIIGHLTVTEGHRWVLCHVVRVID